MKIKFATIGIVAFAGAASAADMPGRYVPPPAFAPPAPFYAPALNWNGFYIGGFGGYGWTGGGQAVNLKGPFGGLTAGYNWQVGPSFLIGLEGEGAGGSIGQTQSPIGGLTVSDQIQAFGSVAARIGYIWGPTLFYLKGGYGVASNKLAIVGGVSETKIHSGYTLGGGLEYMFAPSWSGKLEYLYSGYGSQNYLVAAAPPVGIPSGSIDVQTIKLGVNYHFNWGPSSGPGPLVTRY